jgi:hypothetical protein
MPKLDAQQANLLADLDHLNEARLAIGYGRLPSGVDMGTLQAVKRLQQVGFSMRTADGIARPFPIPTLVAYRIILALRGESRASVRRPFDCTTERIVPQQTS